MEKHDLTRIVDDDIFKEFRQANYNLQYNGYKEPMERFKQEHPLEYSNITSSWRKRIILNDCIDSLFESGQQVYWGCLTFDDKHDKSTEENKRLQAIRHLNKCFLSWVMVEEHGTERERYHVHFIAIFRYDKTIINDFSTWHSRQEIDRVYKNKKGRNKVVRYLTNYLEKQAPRIRKNDAMREMLKKYKQAKSWSKKDFDKLSKNTLKELKYIAEDLPF